MRVIKLTLHTDFALRILLQAAANPKKRLSIADVATQHGISRNHLTKVVNHLGKLGLLHTARGRGGGFSLARDPRSISLGAVVRETEPDMQPADCDNCILSQGCGLTPILGTAMGAFLAVLDDTTLADALERSRIDFQKL